MWPATSRILLGSAEAGLAGAFDPKTAIELARRRGALLAEKLDRHADAAEVYQQLLTLAPTDREAARELRRCLSEGGRHQDVLVAIDRELATTKDPAARAALLKDSARTWEGPLKNRYEALDVWKKVRSLLPDDEETLEAVARLEKNPRRPSEGDDELDELLNSPVVSRERAPMPADESGEQRTVREDDTGPRVAPHEEAGGERLAPREDDTGERIVPRDDDSGERVAPVDHGAMPPREITAEVQLSDFDSEEHTGRVDADEVGWDQPEDTQSASLTSREQPVVEAAGLDIVDPSGLVELPEARDLASELDVEVADDEVDLMDAEDELEAIDLDDVVSEEPRPPMRATSVPPPPPPRGPGEKTSLPPPPPPPRRS